MPGKLVSIDTSTGLMAEQPWASVPLIKQVCEKAMAEGLVMATVALASLQYVKLRPGSLPDVTAAAVRLMVAGAQTGAGWFVTRWGDGAASTVAGISVLQPELS